MKRKLIASESKRTSRIDGRNSVAFFCSTMSEVEAFDNFEEEQPQVFEQAPVVQPAELPDIKLFGRWSSDDIHISDISVSDYIAVKEKHAKYLPHSAGRYAAKRFRKAQCPIVERLTNSLMMKGRNNGKKLKAVRIVRHAFEIMHLLTGENPLQIVVQAIINSGPREDSTRIGRAGTVRRQAVDVSPLRRVNQVRWRGINRDPIPILCRHIGWTFPRGSMFSFNSIGIGK